MKLLTVFFATAALYSVSALVLPVALRGVFAPEINASDLSQWTSRSRGHGEENVLIGTTSAAEAEGSSNEGLNFDFRVSQPKISKIPERKLLMDIIRQEPAFSEFRDHIVKFPGLVKKLESQEHKFTVYIPSNPAWSGKTEELSSDALEGILSYHVVDSTYPSYIYRTLGTMRTMGKEGAMQNNLQRLQIELNGELSQFRLNRMVYTTDMTPALNGVIFPVAKVIDFPTDLLTEMKCKEHYSILLEAYRIAGVTRLFESPTTGHTVFAPTDEAWRRLGFSVIDYLFYYPDGRVYLEALLKYQILQNVTFYSNVKRQGNDEGPPFPEVYHDELQTALPNANLIVDIERPYHATYIKINGALSVISPDNIASTGVRHGLNLVPFPPLEGYPDNPEKITVGELIARLRPFIDGSKEMRQEENDDEGARDLKKK